MLKTYFKLFSVLFFFKKNSRPYKPSHFYLKYVCILEVFNIMIYTKAWKKLCGT